MHAAEGRRGPPRARGIVFALVIAVLAMAWLTAVAWLRQPRAGPLLYTVSMDEYRFTPSALTWRAGDTVTLTVVNDSGATPGKPHEIMFGTGPYVEQGPFGPQQGDGFVHDFLAGSLQVDAAQGVSMLMLRGLDLTGDASTLLVPAMGGMPGMGSAGSGGAGGGMGGMDGMAGGGGGSEGAGTAPAETSRMDMTSQAADGEQRSAAASGAMAMADAPSASGPGNEGVGVMEMDGARNPGTTGGESAAAGTADAMSMDAGAGASAGMGNAGADGKSGMGAMDMYISKDLEGQVEPEMEEMSGNFMLVLEPGGSFTMTFTVPDEPGTWTYGCFQQTGEHFLNGMRGTITVLPASGGSS